MNDRKRQVLLTAQRLFVEKGFSATSVQDILDEAKISKGTFYNYFSTKNECLIAILNNGRKETMVRRQELLIGQDLSDKSILADQISIRQQVNRDHNLLPIFEAIFHSGDSELREFGKKHHLAELSWLAGRLVDVYGEEAAPYSSDCAVLSVGMMQHLMHVLSASSKEELDTSNVVTFVLRRLDSIMGDMIATNDRILGDYTFLYPEENQHKKTKLKQHLLEQLDDFKHILEDKAAEPDSKQYVEFMLEEMQEEQPRLFLLETSCTLFSKNVYQFLP